MNGFKVYITQHLRSAMVCVQYTPVEVTNLPYLCKENLGIFHTDWKFMHSYIQRIPVPLQVVGYNAFGKQLEANRVGTHSYGLKWLSLQ